VDADTPDETLEPIIEKYKKVVVDAGGEVIEAGKWDKGRRPLAYEIAKKREAMYVLMQFTSDAEAPKELDRIFRISDDVMRHLIVRQDPDEE
jgi:small subunit ribosomal protein S6